MKKNKKLASETTREFHEWLHTGALYTLIPDRLLTLRFILGAIDDLIEYYSEFERMNLIPQINGLKIDDNIEGWFRNNFIHFNYRIKGRKITIPWIYGVARSIFLIEKIHQHDWLRRRAGELSPFKVGRAKRIGNLILQILKNNKTFHSIKTPDFTINSRILLRDMIETAISKGLDLSLDNEIIRIEKKDGYKILVGDKMNIKASKVVLCNSVGIKKFTNVKTKTSFAPIAVVSGVPKQSKSFVELDYFPKNCINLLTKDNGFGLAGGISLSDKSKCDKYLDNVIKKHQNLVPSIKEETRYIGIKNEVTFNNQPRGYLYHIVNTEADIWAIVPGKFSLAFSMAPEFYRRVYKKNPKKYFKTVKANNHSIEIVSNTVWMDTLIKNEDKNGPN